MIEIGKYAKLDIVKFVDFGAYLDGGPFGEVLLPAKDIPDDVKEGDEIEVFVYCDSEDRVITTTRKPLAIVGDLAYLEVVQINNVGAFMEWGILGKQLLVPFREQRQRMEVGERYLVYVFFDEKTDRIAASTRLGRYVNASSDGYVEGQQVDIIITDETPMGYKVIIDQRTWGMLYRNEVFRKVKVGDKLKAFVRKVRRDGKIDLRLQRDGVGALKDATQIVLEKLQNAENNFLLLNDKSSPNLIYQETALSKKNFKKAIGILYKNRMITLEKNGIQLIKH